MRQLKITKQVTNRGTKSLDKYLQDISKIPLITAEEEVELSKRIKEGDEIALEKLVNANLRFVVSVAKQYNNQGLKLPDLINEGNLGLVKAAKRFDETRGFKFISYAVWWIRQCILQAIAEQSRIVRLPLNRIGNISKVNKALARIEQEYERMPAPEEIATILDMSVSDVKQTIKNSARHVSMDAPLRDGENSTLYDVYSAGELPNADKNLLQESLQIDLNRILETLSQREEKVLRLFYGLGNRPTMTLEEIGEVFDLSRERVRQIKESAIRKLKYKPTNQMLKAYLGYR